MARKRKSRETATDRAGAGSGDAEVRIIGGTFRGRRLNYHGDPVVRPMKHRTREAIFDLISTESAGRHAIDLFAGTGALGLEALSRGAMSATFIEKHVPSSRVVEQNIGKLGVEDRATLLVTSAFLWAKRDLPDAGARGGRTSSSVRSVRAPTDVDVRPTAGVPWLVFCSPPYAFYHERQAEILELVRRIQEHAPPHSLLIVEADEAFDFGLVRGAENEADKSRWDVRSYPPATVGIWRK